MTQFPDVEEVRSQIETVATRIRDARAAVARHAHVDLKGLEDEVEAVCLLVRAPVCRTDEPIRDALIRLLTDLDRLERDLTQRRDVMTSSTGGAIAPSAAASAYGKGKS